MASPDKRFLDIGRRFLTANATEPDPELVSALDRYEGDLERLVQQLKPTPPARPEKGLILDRGFRTEHLARKNAGERFGLFVPDDYTPRKAHGLLLFLHGGGHSTPRDAGNKVFESYGITDLLKGSGFIVCTPCAPYNIRSYASWNLPEVDGYLMDVIEELEHSYHLDPDRVFLAGHSMGGMGAVHLAQRMSDRFAGVLASGSSWDIAFWPCMMGTHVWLLQGVNDAVMFRRRHGTDIDFTRLMKARLDQAGVAVTYREHSGGHALTDGRRIVQEWLQWAAAQTRDAHYPHVVGVTPRGCTPWIDWRRHPVALVKHSSEVDFHDVAPAPHTRWVTAGELGDETICYDLAETVPCRDDCPEDWDNFHVHLTRKNVRAGLVEAFLRGDGVIEVTPKNVKDFTLWLHPGMVDLADVSVLVKGTERFRGTLRPSLATVLESYRRRRDWGLLYPAKLTIQDDGTWTSGDQIGLPK